ncbi:PD-(D/E)XK motif protein [uncultured Parasutterella sp.]|uniref:PD-(D/E)XK motif protein n=2 Tax=uncultured Parasutterella sp. TaxID=1263098 RepID=UPI00259602A6|nr:PD-(D/E)XK motif protein [uncultured Parasutterella sp.]
MPNKVQDIQTAWEVLHNENGNKGKIAKLVVMTNFIKVYAMIDENGRPGFKITSNSSNTNKKFKFENFEITKTTERDHLQSILVILKDNSLLEPFTIFCNGILEEATIWDSRHGGKLLDKHLSKWLNLLRKRGNLLNEETEIGLFGELSLLKEMLEKKIPDPVGKWKGPEGGKQDFELEDFSVEVKTLKPSARTVKISSLQQLDFPPPVFLLVNTIDKSETGKTLLSLVYEVEALLQEEPEKLQLLQKKLGVIGFSITSHSVGSDALWTISTHEWINTAEDNFPSFRASTSPSSIEKCQYEIRKSSLKTFIADNPF